MKQSLTALVAFGVLSCAGPALAQEAPEEPLAETDAQVEAPEAPSCPPLLGEDGEPVLDEAGAPQFDETPLRVLDDAGAPVLGEDGQPQTVACALPETEPEPEEDEAVEEVEAAPETALTPVMRLLSAGGPVIVILAVLAVLALGVGLVKFAQFIFLGVGRNGFVRRMIDAVRDEHPDDAIEQLDQRRNPVARVMAAAIRGKSDPKMSDALVREETTRVAQAQLDGLERGLALLSLIATIAPLLGLLGTVLGMIEAFQQMETVGDRVEPAVLAGGIWEALLTTAAGLSVAIPAAVFFTWLQRAVDVEGQRMEDAATQVFTLPLYRRAEAAA
ncbi:MAG: MotA/TolQ/ExbB proton channel family protein [Pseudomonadota bacterium]